MRTKAILVFLFSTSAFSILQAQVDTATVVGAVQDSSGAVVPGASVTATEVNTNTKTSTRTDTAGNYVLTPLRIGNYSVAVEAQGFKKETRAGVVLQVQDRVRVDFALQVGALTEAVNIEAEVPVVQTESSSLGDVIGSRQITDLPLNGRDYTQLATLTAGVVKITENGGGINGSTSASNGNAGGAFAVNGTRGNLNNFMLDGIDNNSNDNAGNILRTNVDAIEEFKVQTSNYSAEFGRSGGAVINATIKSGTNQFHGTVFEFFRNSDLDARGFFESPDQAKAPFKQNQFGGTLGGPIKKNKLFFFGDYQGTRVRAANTDIATVPTAAEIGGNFSGLLGSQVGTDALGRPVYQGEIFDPASTTMVNGNVVRNPFQGNIIPASRLDSIAHNAAALYPAPTVAGATANNYNFNAPGKDTIDQMDARVDYNISNRQQIFGRFSLSQRTRFQSPPLPGLADGGNYSTGNYFEGTRGAAIGHTFTISPSMVNELRIGFNRNHYRDNIPSYGQNYPPAGLAVPGVPDNSTVNGLTLFQPSGYIRIGEPGYTPTFSTSQEFQYGDTLSIIHGKHVIKLGPEVRFSQFNLFQVGQPRGRFSFSGEFTADSPSSGDGSGNGLADMLLGDPTTSVISTLTYFGNRQHTYGAFVQDDYKVTSTLTLNFGLRYDYTTPISEAHNRQSNFDFATGQLIVAGVNGASPGLTTMDKDDFAPRAGLAWSPAFRKGKTVIRAGYGRFFSYQEIRTGDPLQLGYNLPFFFEPSFVSDGITPVLTVSGGFPSLNLSQAKFAGVTSVDSRLHAPVNDEWNFNIQNQLPGNILFEVAYVGAKSTHLQVLVDHNQDPTPGPGSVQSRRPYPQYGPFTSIEDHGNSTYESLQLKAEKRLSHGLMFLSAFTYGKSINDQPEICCNGPWPQNSYNLKSEKGLSDFDNRFRWVSSFDYELPVGKGRRFLNSSRPADLVLGGWHVGGILTFRSGFPFSPLMGYDPSNTGSNGLLRTDRIANGNLPASQRSPNLWFDINAFPLPTGYTFGNAGKNILDGPGEKTGDISIRKMFNLTERFNLEFRAEAFNAFNHAVFTQPDSNISDGPGATGVITSTVIPQRQLQFALKLHF
ncbi:MAG TPA: TonB-dependent receptor [Bryobacteraceae bacterium]|nr:TonB-dependent receptor [Bryobacteraceae bacterium]